MLIKKDAFYLVIRVCVCVRFFLNVDIHNFIYTEVPKLKVVLICVPRFIINPFAVF